MIEAFHDWFEIRRPELERAGISLDIPAAPEGHTLNSIHADLRSARYEWTAQVWENGLSDFHFVDWEQMDGGVEVTHYEFNTEEELVEALEEGLRRICSDGP